MHAKSFPFTNIVCPEYEEFKVPSTISKAVDLLLDSNRELHCREQIFNNSTSGYFYGINYGLGALCLTALDTMDNNPDVSEIAEDDHLRIRAALRMLEQLNTTNKTSSEFNLNVLIELTRIAFLYYNKYGLSGLA